MGNGRRVVLVARAMGFEELVELAHPVPHGFDRLQAKRYPVICEGKFGFGGMRFATEMAFKSPHALKNKKAARADRFIRSAMSAISPASTVSSSIR